MKAFKVSENWAVYRDRISGETEVYLPPFPVDRLEVLLSIYRRVVPEGRQWVIEEIKKTVEELEKKTDAEEVS